MKNKIKKNILNVFGNKEQKEKTKTIQEQKRIAHNVAVKFNSNSLYNINWPIAIVEMQILTFKNAFLTVNMA